MFIKAQKYNNYSKENNYSKCRIEIELLRLSDPHGAPCTLY